MASHPPGQDDKKKKPSATDDALENARAKIRERINLAEEAKKLAMQRQRIELVGRGVVAYSEKDLVQAANSFKGYIKILEDLKGAPAGGLSPSHFHPKDDLAEMMLLSGVYWDLVKLYDRTRSPERYSEFKGYLGKYIQFSKGMTYQTMASETMRKYIQAKRPMHQADFKEAYKVIQLSKCFVATELVEHTRTDTIPVLREFRDDVLMKSRPGRRFVAWYYRNGPKMAARLAKSPTFVRLVAGKGIDLIARLVRAQG